MNIKVEIPKNEDKLLKQIKALSYQIEHDINEKDRVLHIQACDNLTKAYLEGV